tara:strand:+ start:3131 stop:4054 length:924 start_codon:yes stop_codon:yes gene_type:complete
MPKEQSVSIGDGENTLFGTLTLPENTKSFDAVLIWSGSGPTDRDGNFIGHNNNCLEMLAHCLAEAGYASLRTDKRGIGESMEAMGPEADLRFENFVEDAVGWAMFLKNFSGARHVFLLGHSEGALVQTIAAQMFEAAGLLLLAGTGFRAADILRRQLSAPDINISEPLLTETYEIIEALEEGRVVQSVSADLDAQFRPTIQPYLISWFALDPQEELAKTSVPVLVIQGTTDMQITVEDSERLSLARPGIDFVKINGMNHVLKDAPKYKPSNYATYGKPLLPLAGNLMPTITEFLDVQAQAASAANDR